MFIYSSSKEADETTTNVATGVGAVGGGTAGGVGAVLLGLTNPVGIAVVAVGGGVLGGIALYKIFKK